MNDRIAYVIPTTVLNVEHRTRLRRAWKVGDKVLHDIEILGWFVTFEGSREALYLGEEQPALKVGERVRITITVEEGPR